ncbi:GDSL-type esterase/lipase family protein [Paenibacillus sp. FSL K6-2441]|uniref:GDSL-type esterase/lipase family protein n=1 Tax=Paenibacillus TaxID=44249 RepID=UPI0030D86698
MATNTPNLNLLKKDPIADGNETFNIQTMLNDNWDKIDAAIGEIDIPDASLTVKGKVQLSNATDGTREDVAATEKAVKLVSDSVASHLADVEQNFNVLGNWFISSLEAGQITKIRVIGDSIAVGLNVPGAGEDPDGRVIVDQGGVVKREPLKTPPGWVNLFRKYIEGKFPNVDFFNAGVGGWSVSEEGVTYRDQWVGTDNDVVFVILGTNDRSAVADAQEFEMALTEFLQYVETTCNHLFVISPSPTLNDFDSSGNIVSGRNITMDVIDRVTTKVCIENKWPHFSFYREFLKYSAETRAPLNQLLQSDGGSHPLASGHMLMWKIMQSKLGITQDTYNYENELITASNSGNLQIIYKTGSTETSSTPITSYPDRAITYLHVSNATAAGRGFPEGIGGTLITTRTTTDSYAWQEYHIIYSNKIYRRYQLQGSGGWSAWTLIFNPSA